MAKHDGHHTITPHTKLLKTIAAAFGSPSHEIAQPRSDGGAPCRIRQSAIDSIELGIIVELKPNVGIGHRTSGLIDH